MTLHRGRPTSAPAKPAPGGPALERILNYGKEGTGKTNSWLDIAEAYPEVPFYCIDTDDSVARMLEADHEDLNNVMTHVAQDWEAFTAGVEDWMDVIAQWNKAHPPKRKEDNPWLIIDLSDATWDMVQNYFTEQVFDQGIDKYFIEARKKARGSQLSPFEGWIDWPVINKIFQTTWNRITRGGGRYHLYITAATKEVTGLENKQLYKSLKAMPRGEKRMPHRVHTILMSSADREGWYLSSAKDRGRDLLFDAPNPNFAIAYLRRVAKWQR